MRTVPELLKEHVELEVECIDRFCSQWLHTQVANGPAAGLAYGEAARSIIGSPVVLGEITRNFVAEMAFAANDIPLIRFEQGQRKDDVAAGYRRQFKGDEGVVLHRLGQEKAYA
ncbi:MAG: hypothetical protein R2856_20870 [Caldilineaceae bacterium]